VKFGSQFAYLVQICGCAIFVIAVLGILISPTEHVFMINTAELASHSFPSSPNNVYTSIRGEVFDLTTVVATHERVVGVVPAKPILTYGGEAADGIFPVQLSALCNGVTGSVSPYVILSSQNNTIPISVLLPRIHVQIGTLSRWL